MNDTPFLAYHSSEAKTTDESLTGYVETYMETNPDLFVETVNEHMSENGAAYVGEYIENDLDAIEMIESEVYDYMCDNYTNNVDTIYGFDIASRDLAFNASGNLAVGDQFGPSSHVTAIDGYYAETVDLPAGYYIDFTNGVIPDAGMAQNHSMLIVTNTGYTITDLVSFADLAKLNDTPFLAYHSRKTVLCISDARASLSMSHNSTSFRKK